MKRGDIIQHIDGSLGVATGETWDGPSKLPKIDWLINVISPGQFGKRFMGTGSPEKLKIVGHTNV
jgi:hypothetical protein